MASSLALILHVAGIFALVMRSVANREVALRATAVAEKRANATAAESAKLRHRSLGPPTEAETTMNILALLQRFKSYADDTQRSAEQRHTAEALRLSAAMNITLDDGVRQALKVSAANNADSLAETKRVLSSISKFVSSLKLVLQSARDKGKGCEGVVCGVHSSCTETTGGAQCVCNEGYVSQGDGMPCRAPFGFAPHRLLLSGSMGLTAKAADMNIATITSKKVAVVWRDVSHADSGKMLLGNILDAGAVEWGSPQKFSGSGKAFDPVVRGTPSGDFAVAWRDKNKGGSCWLRAGVGLLGAPISNLKWGQALQFCTKQAHGMVLAALPPNRVAVFFSDHTPPSTNAPQESFGNSLLVDIIPASGELSPIGNFHFTNQAVTRLAVTMLSPTSFVIGCRSAKAIDELNTGAAVGQEALAVYGEMDDVDLVFDPNPLSVDPSQTQIWSRGVGKIGPNTIGYAYHLGKKAQTMLAIAQVDPVTKMMTLKGEPKMIHEGATPYVSMIPTPYSEVDPLQHTLVLYESGGESKISMCTVNSDVEIDTCEETPWMKLKLTSVSGVPLGMGRIMFAFTTAGGVPYYTTVGVAKK